MVLPQKALVYLYFYAVYGNEGNGGVAGFTFYDSTEVNQIDNTISVGDTIIRNEDSLPKGTYYIEVNPYVKAGGFTPYVLGDSVFYKTAGIDIINDQSRYWQLNTLDAGNLLLTTNFTTPQSGTIEIINALGRIVRTLQLNVSSGGQRQFIYTGDLVNGYYFIRLVDEHGSSSKGFVKAY